MKTKHCHGCDTTKPVESFHKNKRRKDGLQTQCIECLRKARADWYQNNRERQDANTARWAAENRERLNECARRRQRERLETEPEYRKKMREKNRNYFLENKDRINANRRERRKTSPKDLKKERDRRAKAKDAKGHHTQEQLDARYAYYGHKCIYCGCGGKLTLEHLIPLVRGGTHWASNLAPSCRSCNSSKGDKTHSEYLAWLQDNS